MASQRLSINYGRDIKTKHSLIRVARNINEKERRKNAAEYKYTDCWTEIYREKTKLSHTLKSTRIQSAQVGQELRVNLDPKRAHARARYSYDLMVWVLTATHVVFIRLKMWEQQTWLKLNSMCVPATNIHTHIYTHILFATSNKILQQHTHTHKCTVYNSNTMKKCSGIKITWQWHDHFFSL